MKIYRIHRFILIGLLVFSMSVIPKVYAQAGLLGWLDENVVKPVEETVVKPVEETVVKPVEDSLSTVTNELENCLIDGGCDPTKEENWDVIADKLSDIEQEVAYCFGDEGDCSLVEQERWDQYLQDIEGIQQDAEKTLKSKVESLKELKEYVDDPTQGVRKSFELFGKVADLALDGWVSDNFGHVTNKKELKLALERNAIVIYGKEISHSEYMKASHYAAASFVTGNPGPMGEYFRSLAVDMMDEFKKNARRAVDKAPDTLVKRFGRDELKKFKDYEKIFKADPIYLANALATYISTGEAPNLPKMTAKVDLSKFSIDFGILSYNRAERFFKDEIPTPNTHQPYLAITLPDLKLELEKTIKEKTYSYDVGSGKKQTFAAIALEADVDPKPHAEGALQKDSTFTSGGGSGYSSSSSGSPSSKINSSVTSGGGSGYSSYSSGSSSSSSSFGE